MAGLGEQAGGAELAEELGCLGDQPARSQNSTVTTRRSSIPAAEASAAPHRPQNANPPGTSAPQDGQLTMGSVSR